jgi:hypothetical protein
VEQPLQNPIHYRSGCGYLLFLLRLIEGEQLEHGNDVFILSEERKEWEKGNWDTEKVSGKCLLKYR